AAEGRGRPWRVTAAVEGPRPWMATAVEGDGRGGRRPWRVAVESDEFVNTSLCVAGRRVRQSSLTMRSTLRAKRQWRTTLRAVEGDGRGGRRPWPWRATAVEVKRLILRGCEYLSGPWRVTAAVVV
ncbi:hypothetical protein L9F63_023464, partial [Diploptera punctata]